MAQERIVQRKLDRRQSEKTYSIAQNNATIFYSENQALCERAFQYYKDFSTGKSKYVESDPVTMSISKAKMFKQYIFVS